MKISMLCFSLTGQQTGERLAQGLREADNEVSLEWKSKYLPDSIDGSIGKWTEQQFQEAEGIVFIGACGIAVRSIAPLVASKKSDPAVLVIDECGKFAIALLSGHLGGANALAQEAAEILGAQPVVTTATDLHGRFAVDVFAKRNQCAIFHMKAAKEASAALLAGKSIGFYSEVPWEGELPEGLLLCDRNGVPIKEESRKETTLGADTEKPEIGVAVSIFKDCLPFASTVQVVPGIAVLGMGCRRHKDAAGILEAALSCLAAKQIYREAVACVASIDLKKEEPGLLALAERWKIPFVTYEERELLEVPGEFTPSAFVKQVTGVDNVCERSAVLASGHGTLIQRKTGANGVTTALAVQDWRIRFE